MLVWNSFGCSLRKCVVLCTHIIVINCYSFSKIEKNSINSIFSFYFINSTPYCTKALLICLEYGLSHSIPSMFHVSSSRHQNKPILELQWPEFWKIFRDPPILTLFRYFKWNIFYDSKSSGNNVGWSRHTFWFYKKKSKISDHYKNWLVIGMKLKSHW